MSCACTALSKHRVGIEPLFCLDFWPRPCLRRGGWGHSPQHCNGLHPPLHPRDSTSMANGRDLWHNSVCNKSTTTVAGEAPAQPSIAETFVPATSALFAQSQSKYLAAPLKSSPLQVHPPFPQSPPSLGPKSIGNAKALYYTGPAAVLMPPLCGVPPPPPSGGGGGRHEIVGRDFKGGWQSTVHHDYVGRLYPSPPLVIATPLSKLQ